MCIVKILIKLRKGAEMMTLPLIGFKLIQIINKMTSARESITEKNEQKAKLEQALSELKDEKESFLEKSSDCLKPVFTAKTLAGDNANLLTDIREQQVETSFLEMANKQVSKAEEKIDEKIKEIEEEITNLEGIIQTNELKHEQLLAQERELLNRNV